MDRKYLILTLVVMMVVIAAAIAAVMFNPAEAKEPTQVNITSDSQQYGGGNVSLVLADLSETPISNQLVNVTIADENGNEIVSDDVKTDSKGEANLDLDLDEGRYIVNVTFAGNENYTGCNATQNLTIEQNVVEAQSSSSSSQPYTYPSGRTDEEIEQAIQEDLRIRAENGIEGEYDYEGARDFYRVMPPDGNMD